MYLDSPYWDRSIGVCIKHLLPSLPCPQCIATNDVDMERKITPTDIDVSVLPQQYRTYYKQSVGRKQYVDRNKGKRDCLGCWCFSCRYCGFQLWMELGNFGNRYLHLGTNSLYRSYLTNTTPHTTNRGTKLSIPGFQQSGVCLPLVPTRKSPLARASMLMLSCIGNMVQRWGQGVGKHDFQQNVKPTAVRLNVSKSQ